MEGKSPYELWFDRKPRIKHFRVIGSTAYVHIPMKKRKKLIPKLRRVFSLDMKAMTATEFLFDKEIRCIDQEMLFSMKEL